MAPRHPPRFVVRALADTLRERRRRWLLVGAWAGSVVLAAFLAWQFAGTAPAQATRSGPLRAARAENEDLRQQVANLQRAAQVTDVATRELQKNMAERGEEIAGLRTDLGFYSRLVGGSGQRDGLKVQGARATSVKDSPDAWNLVVTLTRNARHGEMLRGTLTLAVDGIRGNAVTTLTGPALGQTVTSSGMPFEFKYFQQVQGTFTLPGDFHPTRLRLAARVDGGAAVDTTVPWPDAIRNEEANDVQQSP